MKLRYILQVSALAVGFMLGNVSAVNAQTCFTDDFNNYSVNKLSGQGDW